MDVPSEALLAGKKKHGTIKTVKFLGGPKWPH